MRAGAYYRSEWKEAPHGLCELHGGYRRSEPRFVGGDRAWCAHVCRGEGCILTCLLKEDPIVQSLHRWAPRRKEEVRREEKKVVISALPPHCRVILALLRESALPSVAVGGAALGPLGQWWGFLFGRVHKV